jgi:hypothetical protein
MEAVLVSQQKESDGGWPDSPEGFAGAHVLNINDLCEIPPRYDVNHAHTFFVVFTEPPQTAHDFLQSFLAYSYSGPRKSGLLNSFQCLGRFSNLLIPIRSKMLGV